MQTHAPCFIYIFSFLMPEDLNSQGKSAATQWVNGHQETPAWRTSEDKSTNASIELHIHVDLILLAFRFRCSLI